MTCYKTQLWMHVPPKAKNTPSETTLMLLIQFLGSLSWAFLGLVCPMLSRKSRNQTKWEELGRTERPGFLWAYRSASVSFCSSLSVFVSLLQAKHAVQRHGERNSGLFAKCSEVPKLGAWHLLLQRAQRAFKLGKTTKKRVFSSSESRKMWFGDRQQPRICERSQHESKSRVQIINIHDLSGKKLQFLLDREYTQPLDFHTCKTWYWKNLTLNNPLFM